MGTPELAKFAKENDGDGRYYVHPHTGQRVPSITSVLRLADKSGLVQWSVDLAVRWCIENWHVLGERSDEAAFGIARYKHTRVRDERAQVGTGIHETVEALHTGSWDFPELDDEQQRIMQHWYALNEEHDIQPIHSEFTVWDAVNEYAGTADGFWLIDGVETVVDIKTSKNHWPEHDAQLAALTLAPVRMEKVDDDWVEHEWTPPINAAIIHLREDKHEIIPVENLDLHYEVFLGYRKVALAKEQLKQREKEAK